MVILLSTATPVVPLVGLNVNVGASVSAKPAVEIPVILYRVDAVHFGVLITGFDGGVGSVKTPSF
jgi:hypothetical protein